MPELDRLWYTIDAQTRGFDEGILKSGDKLKNFAEYAKGAPLVVIGALATAAIAAGVKVAEMGAEFEKQMARVNTAANLTKGELAGLSQQVLDLYKGLPVQSLSQLTAGLYQIASAGIPAGQQMEVLAVASRAAVAGVTDVAKSVDAITSVLNAYRDSNLSAAHAADVMFKAEQSGKITYDQLAGSIGNVVGITAAMGVSLEDLLAGVVQLSQNGISTAEAIDGIRAAISNIIRPSQQFAALFPELAANFNQGKLQAEGFTKFLVDLGVAAKGNTQVFATLFGDVNAYKTVLSLLKDGGVGLTHQLDNLNDSTGAATRGFNEMNETASAAAQRLKNDLGASLTELGGKVLPAYNAALQVAIGLMDLLTGKNPRAVQEATDNLHAFERGILDTNEALSGDAYNNWSRQLGGFIRDVKLGTLDIRQLSQQELTNLNIALTETSKKYANLREAILPVLIQVRELIAANATQAAQGRAAGDTQRQATFAAVGFSVSQGQQSAKEILTPPAESQAYLTALRERDAITKAITESENQLSKAAADAQQALDAGDDTALADAKKRADAARASIESQRAQMKQALGEIFQYELRLQQQVNAVVATVAEATAKTTHSAADDLLAQIEKIDNDVAHVRARGGVIDQASVDRVHQLYDGMVLVAVAADKTKQVLEQTAHVDGTRGTPEDFDAIATREAQLKQLLNGLDKSAEGYADRRRDIEAEILELERRRTELTDRNLESNKKIVDDLARIRNEQSKLIREQAQAIDSLIKAGISLGEAFGVVNDKAGSFLANLSTIGTTIKPFLDELDKFNSGQKDSKGNPLATFATVVSAGLPVLSAATSILGQIFGGGDAAAEQQRKQIVQQNTDAIKSLTRQIGEFGAVNSSGNTFAKVEEAIANFGAYYDSHLSGDTVKNAQNILSGELEKLGVSMADLNAIAQALGITLQQGDLAGSLKQLLDAMQQAQITQFAQTFTGQLDALNAEFQLFDITDPIKQLQKLVDLFNNPNFGAPALREALAGLDLTTPEGRAKAEAAIQALFQQLQAGTLTPQQLGGLSAQQFLDALEQTKKLIDDANGGGPNGTGGYNVSREITESTAGALIAQATTANVWLQRITTASEATAAALRGTSLGALPTLAPPATPNGSVTQASGSGISLTLNVSVVIQPGQSLSDAVAGAPQVGQRMAEEVDKALAQRLLRRDRLYGSTKIR